MEEKNNILYKWILITALAESAGFIIPIIIGLAVAFFTINSSLLLAEISMLGSMTLAGLLEGALLASIQWMVLKKYDGKIKAADWSFFTGLAVVLGWSLGMLPTPIGEQIKNIHSVFLGTIVFLAPLFLLAIAAVQWIMLRPHIKQAGKWIIANALVWPIGVLASIAVLFFFPLPISYLAAVWIISGIMVGIMMGSLVGAITGIALVKILNYKDLTQ